MSGQEQDRTDDLTPALWHRRAVDAYAAGEYDRAMAASSIATVTLQRVMWEFAQDQIRASTAANLASEVAYQKYLARTLPAPSLTPEEQK